MQDSFVLGEEGDDGRRAKAERIEDDSECSRKRDRSCRLASVSAV